MSLVRVTLEYDEETVVYEGEALRLWEEACRAVTASHHIHGGGDPGFAEAHRLAVKIPKPKEASSDASG
jgi:hypothetical protein